MANKPLKSIKFPGLSDTYTVPEVDATLTGTGKAADAKKTGDEITAIKADLSDVNERLEVLPEVVETNNNTVDLFIVDSNGNVLAEFSGGHFKVKNFDTSMLPSISSLESAVALVGNVVKTINGNSPDASGDVEIEENPDAAVTVDTLYSGADLLLVDSSGNVLAEFSGGHIKTKNFDSSDVDTDAVKTVNHVSPDASGNVDVELTPDPEDVSVAVDEYLDEHPVVAAAAGIVSVADYGAVGDGVTDDSVAIQEAVDANYDVYFESNKTYYLASTVTIDHDIHLHGGENTVIKTKTPSGGTVNNAFSIEGTLKKTTTLTTDYTSNGNTDNCNNKFTLTDMTGIAIGNVMVITATDQHYHYAREYYYLGATLLVTDIYDGHIYSCENMPWDIQNTANVSVKIYDAPVAIIENLHFVSDLDSRGHYRYCITLSHCKNSIIRNCSCTQMDNGVRVGESVNCLISDVSVSKSKYDNSLPGDGYGMYIASCTNTILDRIMVTCAQHSISITGTIPCINTLIRKCALTAECRMPGLDTHESTYNLVIEDCVLGTAALNGTVIMNRCRIINNRRASNNQLSLSVYGSHNPEWSRIRITDTVFDGTGISISKSSAQNPIQSYDSVIGSLEIENCLGGNLNNTPTTDATVLSNTIQNLTIKNWKECVQIRFDGNSRIEQMTIEDSTFTNAYFITDGSTSHGIITDNIGYLDVKNVHPMTHKVTVHKPKSHGENYVLPENVSIQLASDNPSAEFIVCGSKLTSDYLSDYVIGNVSGADGADLVRTKDTSEAASLSFDTNGNIVYTQASGNTQALSFYPFFLFYVKEASLVSISATVKNTGVTNGVSFKPMIAIVGADGKIISRDGGTTKTSTPDGVEASHTKTCKAGNAVMVYMYCTSPVAGSETTFEDFNITCTSLFAPAPVEDQFTAKRLTGDGTILSLAGVNNIMSSEDTFSVKLLADYVN